MDDLSELRQANDRFYEAASRLDLEAMESLWLQQGWVRCIHPGWDVLVGWTRIRESWERIFTHTAWLRIIPTAIEVSVFGDIGIVGCAENITSTQDDEVGVAVAQATNIYRRTNDGWRLIHHHASPAPVHVTQSFSGTIQ